MSELSEFFLASKASDVLIETYEISHPFFSKTYRFVVNSVQGISATDENSVVQDYEYMPLRASRLTASEGLDSAIEISVGDNGDVIAFEIDEVRDSNAMHIKPSVVYRGYSSRDYTQILEGPHRLEITDTARADEGAAFEAAPVTLDTHRTGELYTFERFPMLLGFI